VIYDLTGDLFSKISFDFDLTASNANAGRGY
jgi:hypothetical protein